MSGIAYLDTHAAAWMHAGEIQRISLPAQREIERCELRLSPMAYLEFDYLFRRKRIAFDAATVYADLNTTFGVQVCQLPFSLIAALAIECDWTTDPFDRIIVANAIANENAKLVTADERMRKHYPQAIW